MTTEIAAEPGAQTLPPRARRALIALVVGGAAAILDSTIVTIALDRLGTALHAPTTTVQ